MGTLHILSRYHYTMKKNKHLFIILLGLLCWQQYGNATDFVVNGVTYHVLSSSDKTVEVIRNDTLPYTGKLTLPSTVRNGATTYTTTAIGDGAFLYADQLQEVALPNSVKRIGERAFYGCAKLEQANICPGIDSIGHYAFTDCKSLTRLDFPSSLLYIGRAAFKGCSLIQQIHVDNTQPPSLSGSGIMDSFAGTNRSSIVVTVPQGCAKVYHEAKGWSLFAHITDNTLSADDVLLSIAIKGDGCIVYNNEEMTDGNTITLPRGQKVELVVKAGEDHVLQHVYLNDEDHVGSMRGDTLACQALTGNTLVEAVFAERAPYITLCQGENGSVQIDVDEGRPATLHIRPNEGWNINKVMVDDENVTDQLDSDNTLTIEEVHSGMNVDVILENGHIIRGDINNDNYVNMLDVTEIINIILGK